MAGAVKFWAILSRIRNSAGTLFGPRGSVHLNDSASVTWTVTDDPANDEIDVSATAVGGAGSKSESHINFVAVGVAIVF